MELYSDIAQLKGVGEKTRQMLARLNIFTVADLLEYYPRNYDIYGEPVFPEQVEEGKTAAVVCTLSGPPAVSRGRTDAVGVCKDTGAGAYALYDLVPICLI